MTLEQLIPDLQVAVGPVILLSGIGLLMLSMTNRFGRVIDQSRRLIDLRRHGTPDDRRHCDAQLKLLWQRGQLLKKAISLAARSVLFACLMIIVLFAGRMFAVEIAIVVILLFVACFLSVIGAMIYFIRDINLSLLALGMELEIDE
jgi:hypothetical protein